MRNTDENARNLHQPIYNNILSDSSVKTRDIHGAKAVYEQKNAQNGCLGKFQECLHFFTKDLRECVSKMFSSVLSNTQLPMIHGPIYTINPFSS